MNTVLIVKTGTTYPTLREIKGDFDAWVVKGLGGGCPFRTECIDVYKGGELPDPELYAGIIVTGSHALVTEHARWSERTAEWLIKAVRAGVPTLGICYGHQLLAYAFGGKVGFNPNGLEVGTVVVTPTEAGHDDRLLSEFRGPFKAHMCHQQSVLELPRNAVPIATTRMEGVAAFSINRHVWGVQFHPEFDSRILKVYVLRNREQLCRRGVNVQHVFSSCMETGSGYEIFRRFVGVMCERFGAAKGHFAEPGA